MLRVKKTNPIKPGDNSLRILLYALAVFSLVLSQPPVLVTWLALLLLCVSFCYHFFGTDPVTDITELDEERLLLKTRSGRLIPAQISAFYFSAWGQALYCRGYQYRLSGWLGRSNLLRADLLPVYAEQAARLRQHRCLYLAQLSSSLKTSHSASKLSGDSTVSKASERRSGTSMLK